RSARSRSISLSAGIRQVHTRDQYESGRIFTSAMRELMAARLSGAASQIPAASALMMFSAACHADWDCALVTVPDVATFTRRSKSSLTQWLKPSGAPRIQCWAIPDAGVGSEL